MVCNFKAFIVINGKEFQLLSRSWLKGKYRVLCDDGMFVKHVLISEIDNILVRKKA